ncbi:MAG TPA: hypothetical protein VGK73_01520 [Polyangiaceae bacterium]
MSNVSCSCGCNPCVCPAPNFGCITDFCLPRPRFFNGQLVVPEDLNSVVSYFKTREALLAKLGFGWGVFGGMRLVQPGSKSFRMFSDEQESPVREPSPCLNVLLPNPQIIPGATIGVTQGAALDNAGRFLTLCASRTLDIQALATEAGYAPVSKTCGEWFGSFCQHLDGPITAAGYWVVAEYAENPARPVPQFAGVDVCDTGPSCDFSRVVEDVRIRLIRDTELPLLYFLHGCLDAVEIPCADELIRLMTNTLEIGIDLGSALAGLIDSEMLAYLASAATSNSGKNAADAVVNAFGCVGFKFIPAITDFINNIAVTTCCTHPGVVLGRVLLASDVPAEVKTALGVQSPFYTVIDDAFPYRRLIPNAAMHQTLVNTLLSLLVCLNQGNS